MEAREQLYGATAAPNHGLQRTPGLAPRLRAEAQDVVLRREPGSDLAAMKE